MSWLPNRILCQRIAKSVICATICFILCLIPSVRSRIGYQPSMLSLASIMVHPSKRLGTMVESGIYCIVGLFIGMGWALLGRFICQSIVGDQYQLLSEHQLYEEHFSEYQKSLVVLAIFEIIMLFFHGWIRVINHTFFGIVFPTFLVVHFAFLDSLDRSCFQVFQAYLLPFLLGIAISILCNLLIFPEFGSTFLGESVLDALDHFHKSFDDSIQYFITFACPGVLAYNGNPPALKHLLAGQKPVEKKLMLCESVLKECLYEISYSRFSAMEIRFFLTTLQDVSKHLAAIINGCQLEFSLLDNGPNNDQLLEMLTKVRNPTIALHKALSMALYHLKLAIGHVYDIGSATSSQVFTQEPQCIQDLDFKEQNVKLGAAIEEFDKSWKNALETFGKDVETLLLPRDEVFLLSLFILNFKEIASGILLLSTNAEQLVTMRKQNQRRIYFFRKKWWEKPSTDIIMQKNDTFLVHYRRSSSTQHNTNVVIPPVDQTKDLGWKLEYYLSLMFLYCLKAARKYRLHLTFSVQCVMALMLASFPMFLPESRRWYIDIRGSWIGFVCILVVEPSIGNTFWVFFLRGVGIVVGASWGYLSYVAAGKQQHVFVEVIVTVVGAVPGFYFLLGTAYIKGAIIGLVSLYIVVLATVIPSSVGGTILLNWGKRCVAFLYGGLIGLVSNLCVFPIHAKEELLQELSFACDCCAKMQMLYSIGLEGQQDFVNLKNQQDFVNLKNQQDFVNLKNFQQNFTNLKNQQDFINSKSQQDFINSKSQQNFTNLKNQQDSNDKQPIISINPVNRLKFIKIAAQCRKALTKAEAYNTAMKTEPTFKGDTKIRAKLYPEMIFLLGEIVSRMENIVFLRTKYGSEIIEELNYMAYPHRRQVAASINNIMITIREALLNKNPLPQYLPSARNSHKKLVHVVRQFLANQIAEEALLFTSRRRPQPLAREKLLSWCATSAALEEVIDYIDELVELSRILVGVNKFKYSFLSRSIDSEENLIAEKQKLSDLNIQLQTHSSSQQSISSSASSNVSQESSLNPVQYTQPESIRPIATVPSYDEAFVDDSSSLSRTRSIDSFRQSSKNFITRVYSLKQLKDDNQSAQDLPLALKRIISKKQLKKLKEL